MTSITVKAIKSAKPTDSVYFIIDSNLKGFAIRVFPSGTVKYIAAVWHEGRSHRKLILRHEVVYVCIW